MNWQAISGNPFFTVALPLLIGMFVTGLSPGRGISELGKRLDGLGLTVDSRIDDLRDDMNCQFGEVRDQLKSINKRLGEWLATLEERTGFLKPAR